MKHFLKYFLATAVIFVACESNEFNLVDTGIDYFPIKTGTYQIYDVEEIIYSEVAPVKNLNYQLKVAVTDSFKNAEGRYTYVLHRSTREDTTAVWESLDTWSVWSNARELIVNEGNVPFVKLTFPVRVGNTWDGNKYNNITEDDYEILTVDKPLTVGDMIFEKTLTVNQEDNDDVIVFQDQRHEVYARGVGLVYKETVQLNYCKDNNCIGQQQIKSGIIYKQEIAAYGEH